MYKVVLLLLALAAFVFAVEPQQDQEAAEQYFRIHGVYPSWYPYGTVRAFPGYPYGLNYATYPYGVRSFYGAYPAYGYGYNYAY